MSVQKIDTAEADSTNIRAGIFNNAANADRAVANLMSNGFTEEQLTVVCSEESKGRHFGNVDQRTDGSEESMGSEAKYGIAGGIAGGLASLATVATLGGFAGLGIVAVGPIVAGGITGTLLGTLVGRGIDDEKARFYEQEVTRGNILICVESDDAHQLAKAEKIIAESGALPVALDETLETDMANT